MVHHTNLEREFSPVNRGFEGGSKPKNGKILTIRTPPVCTLLQLLKNEILTHLSIVLLPDRNKAMQTKKSIATKTLGNNYMSGLFKKTPQSSPEVNAVFNKLKNFIDTEVIQNSQYPIPLQEAIKNGDNIDIYPGQEPSKLGLSLNNPIPVNGPIGELIYLSSLSRNNKKILFHRLGSIGKVDVFEVVSIDGEIWDILYLDMYHPRKSRMAPRNYGLKSSPYIISGTNETVENFPHNLMKHISESTSRLVGIPLPNPQIRYAIESTVYERTPGQESLLKNLGKC